MRRLLLPSSVQRGEDQEHILEQKKTMAERRRLHALNNHMAPAGPPARGSSCCPAFVGAGAAVRKVGIIMNGVTGRMGTNQHLLRSLVPIIQEGGLALADGTALVPELLLVGRNEAKLAELAARAGNGTRYTTDLDAALAESGMDVYFDAQTTGLRAPAVRKAVAAGMHIYAEKPVADTTDNAADLAAICDAAGVKNGVVQDKLFLPGIIKLKRTIESGFFGRILSIRGEFGYWVFDGKGVPPNRPSWNYRKVEGGGIILDMLAHWRYVLDNLFGKVQAVSCLGATHIPERVDEEGNMFQADADDAAYATFQLEGGAIAHFNSSWTTRVRRDDLLTLLVDGTYGSAMVGLRKCWLQHAAATPKPVWNPDVEQPIDFFAGWQEVPDQEDYPNAFRAEWELFLRHVAAEDEQPTAFPYTLRAGIKGVELAELGLQSWESKQWVQVPSG